MRNVSSRSSPVVSILKLLWIRRSTIDILDPRRASNLCIFSTSFFPCLQFPTSLESINNAIDDDLSNLIHRIRLVPSTRSQRWHVLLTLWQCWSKLVTLLLFGRCARFWRSFRAYPRRKSNSMVVGGPRTGDGRWLRCLERLSLLSTLSKGRLANSNSESIYARTTRRRRLRRQRRRRW